jgi:beta-galactosidase
MLANEVHRLDPTRPVTAGVHGFVGRSVVAGETTARLGFAGQVDETSSVFLDVVGYNYKLPELESIHSQRPARLTYASETLARDVVGYADFMARHPWFLGEFVWTAMDYLGEAGIGATVRHPAGGPVPAGSAFPWVNAFCGDIDLVGQQKPQSLARDVAWTVSPLEMLVERPMAPGEVEETTPWGWADELPSWTWPGMEGLPMTVRVYTSAVEVELALDGSVVAAGPVGGGQPNTATFQIPYASGTLVATGYRGEEVVGTRTLQTTSGAARLRLVEQWRGDAHEGALTFVLVEVLDAEGRLEPEAEVDITLHVEGPADLVAFGSAGPLASGSFTTDACRTWRGRALAVLRSSGVPGAVQVEVHSPGLQGAALVIDLH